MPLVDSYRVQTIDGIKEVRATQDLAALLTAFITATHGDLLAVTNAVNSVASVFRNVGSLVDRSGTINNGNVFQPLFAFSLTAKHRSVQNPIASTETLFVKIGSTIYGISPGGYLERNANDFMPTDAWQVMSPTTSHDFSAAES